MAFCPKCGKQNDDAAKFCTGCGIALNTTQNAVTARRNLTPILVALILAAIAAAAYFLFFNKKNSERRAATETAHTGDTAIRSIPAPAFIAKTSYDVPRELLYTGKRESDEFPGPLYPRFYPIGWSGDGKIAYVEEPADESCGCYFFNIYIQDMFSDKILWTWNTEITPEQGYDAEKGNAYYLKETWRKNNSLFSQKLNEYRIEAMSFTMLEKLPLIVNNNQCNFSIRNQFIYSQDYGTNMLAASTISMSVNGVEKKKVSQRKHTTDIPETGTMNYTTTLSDKLLGYLKNPYENRIAIFYITETRGWEGPPNVINFHLIGCDLNNTGLY